MKNKSLLMMLFILSASVVMAQNDTDKMSNAQQAQAAKADVYIINSKKKITDSFTTTFKDTAVVIKKSKQRSCLKRNKKSS
jgi:hypothetical protein